MLKRCACLLFLIGLLVTAPAGSVHADGEAGNGPPTAAEFLAMTAPETSYFDADKGGAIHLDNVTVVFPPGVVSGSDPLIATVQILDYVGTDYPEGLLLDHVFEVTLQRVAEPGVNIHLLYQAIDIQVVETASDITHSGGDTSGFVVEEADEVAHHWNRMPTEIDLPATTVHTAPHHLSKFGVFSVIPKVGLASPATGITLNALGADLSWGLPVGATQVHLQVIPANNDGPGINLLLNVTSTFTVPAPEFGKGPYVMLPGMTYSWRVRTSTAEFALAADDPRWSAWEQRTFRTPTVTSSSLSAAAPTPGSTVASRTPTLTWLDTNKALFYYEVQLSTGRTFETDPGLSTATVYSSLVHGGMSNPPNSYVVPADFPLASGVTYYWQVRPRVQGDGTPVAWAGPFEFKTQ